MKLKSRKLWIAVASILASMATTVAGLDCDSQAIVLTGIICTAGAGAIYNCCEALVDSSHALGEGGEE